MKHKAILVLYGNKEGIPRVIDPSVTHAIMLEFDDDSLERSDIRVE